VSRDEAAHDNFGASRVATTLKLRQQPRTVQARRQLPISKQAALESNQAIRALRSTQIHWVYVQPYQFRLNGRNEHQSSSLPTLGPSR